MNSTFSLEKAAPLAGNYFVSAYPPFSCWAREDKSALERLLDTPQSASVSAPFGVYVHIPFCTVRCLYCYYLSYASRSFEQMERYI
ncbi:MAG: hypothetical protein ACE5IY_21215, partial [bacterium]